MGLYIDGMWMPKEGRITIQIGADGAVYTVSSCKITAEKYEEKYSAIEVTEPHGRLGDLDALDIYQRAEAAHAEYQEDEDNEYLEGMADGLCEAAKQLSVARTIIPESLEE